MNPEEAGGDASSTQTEDGLDTVAEPFIAAAVPVPMRGRPRSRELRLGECVERRVQAVWLRFSQGLAFFFASSFLSLVVVAVCSFLSRSGTETDHNQLPVSLVSCRPVTIRVDDIWFPRFPSLSREKWS